MILLALVGAASAAEELCTTWSTPAEVVRVATIVDGARRTGRVKDEEAARRELIERLACVADPLSPGDAAAIHVGLKGEAPSALPTPGPDDHIHGPTHPEGGVGVVDGVAYAGLRPNTPAIVQAFDAKGRPVYTRWIDGQTANALRAGDADMPTLPTIPDLPPVPLTRNEKLRLVGSSVLVAGGGALLLVAADARAGWYEIQDPPVETVKELDGLRMRANLTQGAGLACAALGSAGLLSVALRVEF